MGLSKNVQSLLIVPLKIGDQVVGLLDFGELRKESRSEFTQEEITLASAIADQSALLINRMRLLYESKAAKEKLRAYFAAATNIATQNPKQVLEDIADYACKMSDATGARVVLLDGIHVRESIAEIGTGKKISHLDTIRPDGISMNVMQTGNPVAVENILDRPHLFRQSLIDEGGESLLLFTSVDTRQTHRGHVILL